MAEQTKQKILSVSLKLFADRGYHAVSIRDICREVPIKESTLYYYFQNKREIFLVLLKLFEEQAERLTGGLHWLQESSLGGGEAFGAGVSHVFFEEYLMDDFCNSFLRILQIERGSDPDSQALYDRWLFEKPLQIQSRVFSMLMRLGVIPEGDFEALAIQYYAPVFLFLERYLLCGELTEEKKEKFRQAAGSQIDFFFKKLGVR